MSPFDAEHQDFRASVRRYLQAEVLPARETWRKDGVPRALFTGLAQLGAVGFAVPEAQGGAGVSDPRFRAVLTQEAARAGLAGIALMLSAHDDLGVALLAGDGADLTGAASGERVIAWSSSPLALNGERLTGTSRGVLNGGLADVVVLPARDGDDVVLVAADLAGAGVTREPAPELVGPSPCDRADMSFADVEVRRLSASFAGALAAERLALALTALAGARTALELAVAYVHERRAFGQLLASFENTRFALADVAAEVDALEPFVHRCLLDNSAGALTAPRAAQAALRATAAYANAVDWGVQLHGGYGYMYDYEIAHAYASARYLRLLSGGVAAWRATIAADLLGG